MSARMKGKPSHIEWTPERRAAHSERFKGRTFSEETRAKMSTSAKRRDPSTRPSQRGRKHTPEARAKMSAAQRGRVITWGDKISKAKMGIPRPELRGKGKRRANPPNYHLAHSWIRADKGRAAEKQCLDCDGPALHWSFAWRRIPQVEWLWDGHRPYSTNPDHYEARCASCAHRYDMAGYGVQYAQVP